MGNRCPGCMQKKQNTPVCPHCGYDERKGNDAHQLQHGTLLNGKYTIGKVLGQGGFGITYLGWDVYLETPVAIKEYFPMGVVMRDSSLSSTVRNYTSSNSALYQSNRDLFLREAKALAQFANVPQVVQVRNFFEENNTAYIVMEYVQGTTLREYVKKNGKLTLEQTLTLLHPIMAALDQVHKAGIIHRDISPDNIMLLPQGGAKLLDFGAVRNVGGEGTEKSTQAILKQGYAPLEQYQAKGDLGPWTDVYALCATIFFCLTGETPAEAPERMLEQDSLNLSGILSRYPRTMAALEKGLALRKGNRTASVAALGRELYPVETPVDKITVSPGPAPSFPKWLIALLAVLVAVASVFAMMSGGDNPAEETVPESTVAQTEPSQTAETVDPSANVMMERAVENDETEGEKSAYGTAATYSQIKRITFVPTLQQAPSDAVDVSSSGDGKVLAWIQPYGDGYDLFIGGEGGVYAPENCHTLFALMPNLTAIDFGGCFYTDNTTDISSMFFGCESLQDLDLSGFKISGITSMYATFYSCKALEKLDLSGFDTSCVTDMRAAFQGCESLKELNLSGIRTDAATQMAKMFYDCSSLEQLDLSGFRTANVTDMSFLFYNCSGLKELDVSHFNTSRVKDMQQMFYGCSSLAELDVSGFVTTDVENMYAMFYNCSGLTTLDISAFNTGNVQDMGWFFGECINLSQLNLGQIQTGRVTNMQNMFHNCGALRTLDVSGFDTHNVQDMSYMFHGCSALTELAVDQFDTRNVKNMEFLFFECSGLQKLNVSGFDTQKVTSMRAMFNGCSGLTELDVSGFKTGKVTTMETMFSSCTNVKNLDVRNFDTANVTTMESMFYKCYELTELKVDRWNTGRVQNMRCLFYECSKLKNLDVSGFRTGSVVKMNSMFNGCSSLSRLNVSGFDTSNVETMNAMFCNCTGIKNLNVSKFRTEKVRDMGYMFYGCGAASTVSLGNFVTAQVENALYFMEDDVLYDGESWKTLFPADALTQQ